MALYFQKLSSGIIARNSNYDTIYFAKTNNVLAVVVTSNNSAGPAKLTTSTSTAGTSSVIRINNGPLLAKLTTFISTAGTYSVIRNTDGFITEIRYAGSPIKTYTYSSPGVISTITEVINSLSSIVYITKNCTYDANGLLNNINVV